LLVIQELYSYSSRVRRRFVDRLGELPWEQVEKDRKGSFHSMKNILLHIIDNEDWIVNWVIPGKAADYVRRKSEEYTSMQMVTDHLDEVEKRTRSYLKNIGESELGMRVKFTISSGDTFNLSVEESLFQSFTEQLFHIGELIALLWQIDIEPPMMQWFWNNPRQPEVK